MFSITSYNVMFNDIILKERHNALMALLLKNKTDVICLQEVLGELVPWFITMLSADYRPVKPTLIPEARRYGEMIFVKHGIEILDDNQIQLESNMGRHLNHVCVEKEGIVYNIVTFHFESLNSKNIRARQRAVMWDKFQNLDNCIYCGDTNMKSTEELDLPERVLDAWEQTEGDAGEWTYWGHRYWENTVKERYDRIWYSRDLTLVGFGVLGNNPIQELDDYWISDHDGLVGYFKHTS